MKFLALLPLLGSALGAAINGNTAILPEQGPTDGTQPKIKGLKSNQPVHDDPDAPIRSPQLGGSGKPISPESFTSIGNYKYSFGPDHLPLEAFNMTPSDITTPNPDFSSDRLAASLGLHRRAADSPFEYNLICRGEGSWASHHAAFQCREWLASRTYDHWRVNSTHTIDLCTVKDSNDVIIAHIVADTRSDADVNVQASAAALAVQGIIDMCGWCTEKVCRTGGTNDLWGYLPWALHVFAPKTYREGDD